MRHQKLFGIVIILIVFFSVGCSSHRNIKKAHSAEKENRWQHAVNYYEKAHKKSLFKKKTEKLVKKARKKAAYYYYQEALYTTTHKKDFLADQEKALENIRKALAYIPDEKKYIDLKDNIVDSITALKFKVEADFCELEKSVRKKNYFNAFHFCETILYIDPVNIKAQKLKEKLQKNGSIYYLKQALQCEENEDYSTAVQFLEYSIELRTTIKAETALDRLKKKNRANLLFKGVWQKISMGDYKSNIDTLREMVALDNTNIKYRKLLVKGLSKKIAECVRKEKNREAVDTIIELKKFVKKKYKFLEKLNSLENQVVSRIINGAENDLENNLPGNALELLLWLDNRALLGEKGQAKLEKSKALVLQNAVPSLGLSEFSGNLDAGAQFSNGIFKKIYQNHIKKCLVYNTDEGQVELKSDMLLKYEEPVKDFSKYIGQLKGTSLMLKGVVESFTFRHSIDKVETEKSYISHYEKVINPEYIVHMNSDKDGLDLPEVESKGLSTLFLVLEVASAVVEMIPPPKYLEKPVYRNHHYTIEEHHVDSSINFSFLLIDETTGKILLKKQLSESLSLRDTYVPGSVKAKIVREPLELDSDYEIKQQVIGNAVNKTIKEIYGVLDKLPEILCFKARVAKEAGDIKLAKEYRIMAVVFKTPLSSLSNGLWPLELKDGVKFNDNQGKVIVETIDSEIYQIQPGDTLVKVNGTSVNDEAHALKLFGSVGKGSLVEVIIQRDGQLLKNMLILNPVSSGYHFARL